MRDAASALGVDPYTWILAGGDDHPLVGDVPARTPLPEGWLVIGRVLDGTGVTVDGRLPRRDRPAGTTSGSQCPVQQCGPVVPVPVGRE